MRHKNLMFRSIIGLAALAMLSTAARADNFMIQVEVGGQRLEGRPLSHSNQQVELMLRDGQYVTFRPNEARNFRQTSPRFRSYSASEMRSRLADEFGAKFSITGTGHYLVVHPRGQKDLWARRFEDLYRDFVHYFSVRSYRLNTSQFPLVAIVWPNEQDFRRNAARSGISISSSVIGYYYPISNRINLYNAANSKNDRAGWKQNADTIIHEAAHQTAFNTGVHARFADTPKWVIEGLGTMFEAPGVYSSREYRSQRDRFNNGRLSDFKAQTKKRQKGFLVDLISSDDLFESDAAQAYAQAWALTFWLVETRPRQYSQYLALTAKLEPGEVYSAAARMKDFTSVFGDNFKMHEARFTRFMQNVK